MQRTVAVFPGSGTVWWINRLTEVPLDNYKKEKAPFPEMKWYSEPTALIPE